MRKVEERRAGDDLAPSEQDLGLKDVLEFSEGVEFDQLLAFRGRAERGVLKDPRAAVEEEDGVEAGGECWVDVALGTVADHPA
jgi:hypothetical protein